jgi:hypothetical protein
MEAGAVRLGEPIAGVRTPTDHRHATSRATAPLMVQSAGRVFILARRLTYVEITGAVLGAGSGAATG